MAFTDAKKQFLKAVDMTDAEIAAVEEVMAKKAKSAQDEGLHSREQQPVVVVNNAQTVPAQEPQPQQQPVVDVETQLKQAQEFIVKALEPYLAPLIARLTALEAEQAALKQAAAATPAASSAASILDKEGAHQINGRGDKGPKENNSDKEGQATPAITGVPFVDNLISLNNHAAEQRYKVGG